MAADLVVLDTNVLVAAAYSAQSASRRIVQECLAGRGLTAVTSPALVREYEFILGRALRGADYVEPLWRMIEGARSVEADAGGHHVPGDPEDAKLLAVAVAAGVLAIVTNDHHLLELDPYQGIRIVRPRPFVQWRLE